MTKKDNWKLAITHFGPNEEGRIEKLGERYYTGNMTFEKAKEAANNWANMVQSDLRRMGDTYDRIEETYEDRISLCYTTESMNMFSWEASIIEEE